MDSPLLSGDERRCLDVDESVSLADITHSAALLSRPSGSPDFERTTRAVLVLSQVLIDSPQTIFDELAAQALALLDAGSAGISLLPDDESPQHRSAFAGRWNEQAAPVLARSSCLCAELLALPAPVLLQQPHRRYHEFRAMLPLAIEWLSLPFRVAGMPVGIVWAVAHEQHEAFDAEDLRQLEILGEFAAAAYSRHLAHVQGQRSDAAAAAREAFNRSIIDSSPDCIKVLDLEGNLLSLYNGEALLGISDIRPYLNRPWLDFWEGDFRVQAERALNMARAGQEGQFVGFFRTLRGDPKWWDVRVSPIRGLVGTPERLLAVSRDVTRSKELEISRGFVASLSEDLARFMTVHDMLSTVGARLGEHLGLSLCAFVEIDELAERVVIEHDWHREDVPSLVGEFRLADFVEPEFIRLARAGAPVVVNDVSADERTDPMKFETLRIASFICAPLIADRQWRFALCLYKSEVHQWRGHEVEMARELTARVWARLERIRTEAALGVSEARYRALFEQMDEGYCVIEVLFDAEEVAVDFRYLDTNPSFERESGVRDARGRWVSELVPNLEPYWLETYGKVALTGQPIRYVNESVELGGRWFDLYAFRVGEEGSRQVGVLFRDIKQQRNAARALFESEERYRTLFNSMDEAFYIVDVLLDAAGVPYDYRFLEVNPAFERQTGMSDAVGRCMRELVPEPDQFWCEQYGNVLLTGEPVRFTRQSDTRDAWLDVYAFRIGEAGSRKVAVISSDITVRTNAEHALRDAAAKLVEVDQRKDEFLAMLGHELRNPLAPIATAVKVLQLHGEESAVQQGARAIIERQLGQLTRLVEDLIEVSRINTGTIQLRKERVVLNVVIERALETVQPLIHARGHMVTVSVPLQTVLVFADAARLEQTFVNLLANAIKYSDDEAQISLTLEADTDTAVVRVLDTGIGIASDLLPHIFDVFTQGKRSLDRSQGGLGVGLSLVKRMVDLHAGTVHASSVLGEGTEFIVRLPRLVDDRVELFALDADGGPAPVSAASPAMRRRVLVVDDNVDAVTSLALVLEMLGHDVQLAHDGSEALDAARRYRPDMMLLDIGLPGLSGLEVAKRIRLDPELQHITLVAMTGYGQAADRQRSRDNGFDHHVVKPPDFDMLDKILRTVPRAESAGGAD